jgi:hypothetical protein
LRGPESNFLLRLLRLGYHGQDAVLTCEGGRTGGHKSLATTSHWQAWSSVLYTDASEVASDSRASRRAEPEPGPARWYRARAAAPVAASDCENDRDRDSEIDFVVPRLTGANLYGTTGGPPSRWQHHSIQSLAPGTAAGEASSRAIHKMVSDIRNIIR